MAGTLLAQVAGGTIQGQITDPTGAVLPGAEVTVTQTSTGVSRSALANSAGFYSLPNLQPSIYSVSAGAAGFAKEVANGITLTVGASLTVNLSLKVGASTQQIEVQDVSATTDLTSSSISEVVDSETVRELPLNGRDWSQLITLQPGADQVRNQSAIGSAGTSDVNRVLRGFGSQMSIAGTRPQQNNYRLDGVSFNDYTNGAPGGVLGTITGVDAVQEFSVITTNYSAEYGKTSGGVVNAITRSGTNAFHGSAYDFLRNSALDARNYFDGPTIAPFRRNQFGGSIGGPVLRDKTFFFANYEGLRQSLGVSQVDRVPSQNARNGIISNANGGNVTVDSAVKPYLAFWPLPNAGLDSTGDIGYYRVATSQIGNENFYTAKVDHHLSLNDSLSGSFQYDSTDLNQPDSLNNLHFVNKDARTFVSLEETHIFNPNVINTVRFGFSRNHAISNTANPINPLAGDPALASVPGRPAPFLIVPGWTVFFGGVGGFPNFVIGWNSFQFYDDAFITHGAHSFKFGLAVERMQSNNYMRFTQNGRFVFGSFSDFLKNNPLVYGVQLPSGESERGIRETLAGGYAQDSWRARHNLTINYGLRYEVTTVPTEVHNRLSTLRQMTDANVHIGDPYFSNPTLKDFSPRVGFAWDPVGNGKTAVRGGMGIYDVLPLPYLFLISAAGSAPFTVDPTVVHPGVGTFPNKAYSMATDTVAQSPLAGERVSYFDPHPRRSLTYNWNLNVQQELGANRTVTVAYVGSRGVHLPYHTDDANIVMPTHTANGWVWPSGDAYLNGNVLNPNVGDINRTTYDADSYYHSLQIGFQGRIRHALQLTGAYTWGRSIDSGSSSIAGDQFSNSPSSVPLWFDPKTRRGLSDFNLSHNGVISILWDTPEVTVQSPVLKWAANGWQTGAIFQASSGSPFSVFIAGDPLGMNSTDPWAYPDRLKSSGCGSLVNPGKPDNYIKLQCFSAPVQTIQTSSGPQQQIVRLGNAGRNELVGPGLSELDFSIVKNSKIERLGGTTVQFRVEAFNILNKSNFAAPLDNYTIFNQDGTPADGAGVVDQTQTTSRQIQFGLKILF
ncbi:MAG TPA: TonB-dependent receptor [Acidisarcina sp.]|nr:TonB-dependent receptor [Acidisarcina sp.]